MKQSAGILLYRGETTNMANVEVLLVHPGGPFWAKKDEGAWSIPKGEFTDDELPLDAAKREFAEELGMPVPAGTMMELGEVRQSSGKVVHAWALHADLDTQLIQSNTFELEWPPRSGTVQQFPEVDRVAWFRLDAAMHKLVKGQRTLIERLAEHLGLDLPELLESSEAKTTPGMKPASDSTGSPSKPITAAADATSGQTKLF